MNWFFFLLFLTAGFSIQFNVFKIKLRQCHWARTDFLVQVSNQYFSPFFSHFLLLTLFSFDSTQNYPSFYFLTLNHCSNQSQSPSSLSSPLKVEGSLNIFFNKSFKLFHLIPITILLASTQGFHLHKPNISKPIRPQKKTPRINSVHCLPIKSDLPMEHSILHHPHLSSLS